MIPGLGRSHSSILGLPCGSAGKESACNVGDLGLIPGLGISKGTATQYSGLENSGPWGRKHGLFGPSAYSMRPTHTMEGNLLYSKSADLNVNLFFKKTPKPS